MTVGEKLATIKENVSKVYVAGSKADKQRAWDIIQKNGSRTDYKYAFYGLDSRLFYPTHDLVISDATSMFENAHILGLKSRLEQNGVGLYFVTDAPVQVDRMFFGASVTYFPKLDFSNADSLKSVFSGCDETVSIDELVLPSENVTISACFYQMHKLTHMLVSGTIKGNGINLQWSGLLDVESLVSILEALEDKTEDTSTKWTVTIGSENYAKLSTEQIAIAENKGWVLK